MSTLKALFRSQKAATTPVAQKQSLKVGMDALPLCQRDRNLTLDFDNAFLLESLCSIGQRTRDTAEADIVETKDVDSESPGKFWQVGSTLGGPKIDPPHTGRTLPTDQCQEEASIQREFDSCGGR